MAPAKINLHLHVLGRLASGLHRIDSALAFVDIFDVVRATEASGLTLSVAGPMAPSVRSLGDSNYVLRAASELRTRAGVAQGAALHLDKHVPPGAGLAGGTADGAAALRALGRLWGLRSDDPAVEAAASALGADGPACLRSQACWAHGTGTELSPMRPPRGHLAIAWPGVELATSQVYSGWQGPRSRPARYRREEVRSHLARTRNDLEVSAVRLSPAIGSVLAALASLPSVQAVRMTGSGTAAFGLFSTRAEAEAAVKRLREVRPRWWIRAASFLATGPVAGRLRPAGGRSGLYRTGARR